MNRNPMWQMVIPKELLMKEKNVEKNAHISLGIHINSLLLLFQENNSSQSERNSQIPSPTDYPPCTLKRQSSLTFQSSDPEEFRQSLLTAIRSGEAAAKLKRVSLLYQMGGSGFIFNTVRLILRRNCFLAFKLDYRRCQKLLFYVRGHF